MQKYNLVVIGAGQGGIPAALLSAKLGASVAVIEKREVGGTWVIEGCIPSKTLLRSAEVMRLVTHESSRFGVHLDVDSVKFNLTEAVARKDKIVKGIIDGIQKKFYSNENITYIKGEATFTSPKEIAVNDDLIEAENFIIDTGSKVFIPPIEGIKEVGFITNFEALSLKKVPDSMIIIGGGMIGIEFAQMYSRFGTAVTLLGRNHRLLPKEEHELSEMLLNILKREGIDVFTGAEVVRAIEKSGRKNVTVMLDGKDREFTADEILLGAGRIPNTEIGLEKAGVELNGSAISVNDELKTTADNIWAIGDVLGGHMYTHKATYDASIAALNAIKDLGKRRDYRVVPRAIFTQPNLASVGLTEAEAL